jgi:hypothetical protein
VDKVLKELKVERDPQVELVPQVLKVHKDHQ